MLWVLLLWIMLTVVIILVNCADSGYPKCLYSLHYRPLLVQISVKCVRWQSDWLIKHIESFFLLTLDILTSDWYQKMLNICFKKTFSFSINLHRNTWMPCDQSQLFLQPTFGHGSRLSHRSAVNYYRYPFDETLFLVYFGKCTTKVL